MPLGMMAGGNIEQEAELVLVVPDRLMAYLRYSSPAELKTIGMAVGFPCDRHYPNSESDQYLSNQVCSDHLYQNANIPGNALFEDLQIQIFPACLDSQQFPKAEMVRL